jgi:long-chain acyl-CoA synthetase
MEIYESASLPAMFFAQARRLGDRPFLFRKRNSVWETMSWTATARQIDLVARGLKALGLANGDRVLLVSENRPEWLIADLAIMSAGGVTVPAYTTNTVADHLHLLNDSGARMAIVSSRQLAERIMVAAIQADHPPQVIAIDTEGLAQNPGVDLHTWNDLLTMGDAAPDIVHERVDALKRGELACLIYTSGTGGRPKGVMLSHGAIMCNCLGAFHLLLELGLSEERFLSFLPLSHSYEHTAGQFFPISLGAQIWYAEGLEQLVSNMADCRPTMMTAVPRLYEVMRTRILASVERSGGFKAKLFRRAVALGSKRYAKPGSLTILEWLENQALNLLVRRKVANRFGGNLKALVSGGAPLNYDVGLFFTALGVRLVQGYGQTEAAPVISANRPLHISLRTVGPPLKGVELRIAEDGEILVRGEMVMLGYWKDPAMTAQVIKDGWLHTGDIGVLDEDGNIQITDRKKDLIVNSGGDNVSPQRVEGYLTLQPEIAQAMVYGDRRPHLVALVVPAPESAAAWAAAHGLPNDLAQLVANPDFRRHIGDAVDRVNRELSAIERVRRFALTAEAFTVANEMSTPTLKIRRHAIVGRFKRELEELYEERRA